MDLIEGITNRRSIRVFKKEPVSEKVIRDLLDVARKAPSSFNQQSWEFIVLTGTILNEVKLANQEQFERGITPHPDAGFRELSGKYRERQIAAVSGNRSNPAAPEKVSLRGKLNVSFHDAPVGILVCSDQAVLECRAFLEGGIVAQNIALAALHFGLGTCLMMAPVYYPEVLRKVAHIPATKRIIIGIAVGHPDPEFSGNFKPHVYEPLSEFVSWPDQSAA